MTLTGGSDNDLGYLRMDDEDIHKMKKAKSEEELFQGLQIIQKTENWYRTPGKRRHSTTGLKARPCQYLGLAGQMEEEECKPKMVRLQSEPDIQGI